MISAIFLTFNLSCGTAGPVFSSFSQCLILITHIAFSHSGRYYFRGKYIHHDPQSIFLQRRISQLSRSSFQDLFHQSFGLCFDPQLVECVLRDYRDDMLVLFPGKSCSLPRLAGKVLLLRDAKPLPGLEALSAIVHPTDCSIFRFRIKSWNPCRIV